MRERERLVGVADWLFPFWVRVCRRFFAKDVTTIHCDPVRTTRRCPCKDPSIARFSIGRRRLEVRQFASQCAITEVCTSMPAW